MRQAAVCPNPQTSRPETSRIQLSVVQQSTLRGDLILSSYLKPKSDKAALLAHALLAADCCGGRMGGMPGIAASAADAAGPSVSCSAFGGHCSRCPSLVWIHCWKSLSLVRLITWPGQNQQIEQGAAVMTK